MLLYTPPPYYTVGHVSANVVEAVQLSDCTDTEQDNCIPTVQATPLDTTTDIQNYVRWKAINDNGDLE